MVTIIQASGVIEVILVGVWIYLVWMVWKKKTNIFHDQMESKLAERRLKRLKTYPAGNPFTLCRLTTIPINETIPRLKPIVARNIDQKLVCCATTSPHIAIALPRRAPSGKRR